MRTNLATCCVILLTPLGIAMSADDEPKETKKPIELPDVRTTDVISLDFKGGFTPPRLGNSPTLSILADGTVLIPDNYGPSENLKSKISPDELQELLSFILDEQQFFEIKEKTIAAKVKEAQKPKKDKSGKTVVSLFPQVADAPTTVIQVQTKDRKHEVKWYALSMAAGQHPDIDELQQLRAIEQKLQRLMIITHAGGLDEVKKQLDIVNDRVQAMHPDAPPLTAEHLVSASRLADGSQRFFWQWSQPGKDGTAQTARFITVNQQIPAEGEPTYNINVKLK